MGSSKKFLQSVRSMIGKSYGRLTVLRMSIPADCYNGSDPERTRLCTICTCGNIKLVLPKHLRSGAVRSCGCKRLESTSGQNNARFKDLTGKTFGRLTVIRLVPRKERPSKYKHANVWRCLCDCGNEKLVPTEMLNNGAVKSCGCLFVDFLNSDRNPWYNPDLSDEDRYCRKRTKPYNKKMEYKWSSAARKRTGYKCEITGVCGIALSVHHILGFTKYPELRFDQSNAFVMDTRLHLLFHSSFFYASVDAGREELEEFAACIKRLSHEDLEELLSLFYYSHSKLAFADNKDRIGFILEKTGTLAPCA